MSKPEVIQNSSRCVLIVTGRKGRGPNLDTSQIPELARLRAGDTIYPPTHHHPQPTAVKWPETERLLFNAICLKVWCDKIVKQILLMGSYIRFIARIIPHKIRRFLSDQLLFCSIWTLVIFGLIIIFVLGSTRNDKKTSVVNNSKKIKTWCSTRVYGRV